ncbi:MAG: hypothetical protein CBC38_02895 [Gammaproteobacteria bacterium TMED78]|nr:MAG: hypothetical protein CBC38_02895 [Gammaproteobacteria bacterium TMED78]|tara:strand:+ start:53047 stop:54159 length:1113 start_codon:yes stop_codon:yes gene_type:complete
MSKLIKAFLFIIFFYLIKINYSFSHHSFAFEFDIENKTMIEGEVTWVRFTNPHVTYRIKVEVDNGSFEEWQIQTHNVRTMLRLNWDQDTVEVGDYLKAFGALGRNSTKKLFMERAILNGGATDIGGEEPRNFQDGGAASAYDMRGINANSDIFYGVVPASFNYDITGAWTNRYKFRITAGDLEPKPIPFTEEGKEIFESTQPWQDPAKTCAPVGLPRAFGAPFNLEIHDAGDHYLMIIAGNVRRVWLDNRNAPQGLLASPMGFSKGKWADNVLTIETTNLSPSWLDGLGHPMSGEETRIIETYTLSDDQLSMDRKMVIFDPYYTEPLIRLRGSARDDNINLVSGSSPCDPAGHYRDMIDQGLLESLWSFD